MKKKLHLFWTVSLLLFIPIYSVAGEIKAIELITAYDMPPVSMHNDPSGYHGAHVELFEAICKKIGIEPKITYQPWTRVQNTAAKRKNVVIIGIGRTPEREKKYIWISKVHPSETAFVTINGKQHDIESGKLLKVVLVQSATPFHSLLIKLGYTNLSVVPVNALNAKKLAYGRGDAWFTPTSAAKWMWKREGLTGELTIGPVILKSEQWMCLSLGSDTDIPQILERGITDVKADGTYNKIIKKYY